MLYNAILRNAAASVRRGKDAEGITAVVKECEHHRRVSGRALTDSNLELPGIVSTRLAVMMLDDSRFQEV